MYCQPRVSHYIYKKEIKLNLQVLHKLQPMQPKIAQIVFEENGLDKLTQNVFNNLTYYLLFLVDPQFHITWPLFDTKAEKVFRSELSRFISSYASKGHLTDVRASYLVLPSCFKVTVLIHQLTVLAIKQMLLPRIKSTEKQKIFDEVTEKYNIKSDHKSFSEYMTSLNYENKVFKKLATFLDKKQRCERIAEMMRMKIAEAELKLSTSNAQGYLNHLVDNFIKISDLTESGKCEILKMKNIEDPAPIFDDWLQGLDTEMGGIEKTWNAKVSPLLEKCRNMQNLANEIVKRRTGLIDRSSYILEYDPVKDTICTDALQNEVNSSQKFILKNIEQNGRLNFPNLIQAFVISMCHILKSNKFGNEIYEFNACVKVYTGQSSELREGYQVLIDRLDKAESKLQLTTAVTVPSVFIEDYLQIPPLPDLSGLKMSRNKYHFNFDTFTPINLSKYQFNLRRRGEAFTRPPSRSMLTAYHGTKDDFLKTLISSRAGAYDRNMSHNINLSAISNIKSNETIAECSSRFTKQQIARLLSTKKSSTKKRKMLQESHDNIKIKKGCLFDKPGVTNDSQCLFRSHSSPNLFEISEKTLQTKMFNIKGRKLSIMPEDSPPQHDVSGIACLNDTTPSFGNAESSRNTSIFPITKELTNKLDQIHGEIEDMVSPISVQDTATSKVVPKIIVSSENIPKSHLSDIVNNKEMPRISISSILEKKSHSSANVPKNSRTLARNSRDTHLSKVLSTNDFPDISISPITEHKDATPHTVPEEKYTASPMSDVIERRLSSSPIHIQEVTQTVTPKCNTGLIKKTSSLEKIINRFKQIRANVIPLKEENENTNDVVNRNLLPDLLSPSFNLGNTRSINDDLKSYLDSDDDFIQNVK